MAGGLAVVGVGRSFAERAALLDEAGGRSTGFAAPAALGLGAGQVAAPAPVIGAPELGVDEAVDALVTDHGLTGIALHAAGDLFRRPAGGETAKHCVAQAILAFQP